jgi:hypothetical protein
MRSAEAKHWKEAIESELNNLRRKVVWWVRPLPKKRKALGARWVFAKKLNDNGSTRYKAQYVAKGYNQAKGMDYAQTFAPTATFTSMCILLTVAARHNWPV